MTYTHTRFSDLKTSLAARLGDPNNVFWSDPELGIRLIEALRMWNAYTGYWRDRAQFATTVGEAFYDIPAKVPNLRGYSVTGQSTFIDIEYHLLENPGVPWTGTDQFNQADVQVAIQRRRDQFLVETGCVITRSPLFTAPPAQIGCVPLPTDKVIDIRRLTWTSLDNVVAQLWRTDEFALTGFAINWPQNVSNSSIPLNGPGMYSVSTTPPLTIQLAPPPQDDGQLQMWSVNSGTPVDLNNSLLGIPDDFAWVITLGAMADVLSADGQGRDDVRVKYCDQRWKEGIELARMSISVVQARINDVPLTMGSLKALDGFRPDWQNTSGMPDSVAMAGLNLMALAYVPNDVYSVNVDVVRNAPLPTGDNDYVQIGREFLDVILDEAQHACTFKEGGLEFITALPLYQRFTQAAMLQNDRLRANARFMQALDNRAWLEEANRPRLLKAANQ